jgi:hypothetical protein
VALLHQPRARVAAQRIGEQVSDIRDRDVQRATGVAFGIRLEIVGAQLAAVGVDTCRVGHVRHQPQSLAGDAIGGGQQCKAVLAIFQRAARQQLLEQRLHALDGLARVLNHAITGAPACLGIAHRHRSLEIRHGRNGCATAIREMDGKYRNGNSKVGVFGAAGNDTYQIAPPGDYYGSL